MNTHLQTELEQIKSKIFQMADRAMESIARSVEALKNSDAKKAHEIIAADSFLDALEKQIDEDCIRVIVTRQPAACDLRFVLALIKINTDLERIGDLATNIAKETIVFSGKSHIKALIDIPRMSEIAIKMIGDALDSITDMNAEAARKVIETDKELDGLNMQINRELFSIMVENPAMISQAFSLITIARTLERIGDHATNIAERAVYFVEGIDIRHTSHNCE